MLYIIAKHGEKRYVVTYESDNLLAAKRYAGRINNGCRNKHSIYIADSLSEDGKAYKTLAEWHVIFGKWVYGTTRENGI